MATVATIIAIILGPILAIQVQKIIERLTQKRDEKRKVFMTLLTTRGRQLAPEHVQALNMIHFFFSGKHKKDQAVVEAWDLYRDHLFTRTEPPKPQDNGEVSDADRVDFENRVREWLGKSDELLCSMLRKMAESLGYHFPELWLKKGAYTPQGYGEMEENQRTILHGLAEILLGIRSFPMKLTEFPVDEEANKAMKLFLQGKQTLPVSMGLLSEVLDKADKENKSKEA
jgi:hypothetical protein